MTLTTLSWAANPLPASARMRGPLVPSHGALFGTTVGPADYHPNLEELEQKIGRKFDIVQHYHGWGEAFPFQIEKDDVAAGRIPMIGWVSGSLQDIASGNDDDIIRARAQGLKALGGPVFLRWGYEMNGNWFSWSGIKNGGANGGPALYVKAYRHIHDIFENVGANNVVWVWAPNWQDVPGDAWNHWTHYYPGKAYVDWIGIDGFNWGTTQNWSKWTAIGKMLRAGLYKQYHTRKPMMIAETASVEQGGDKARWITGARNALKNRFPGISAFIYYNDEDRNQPVNWCVDTSSSALSAFKAMAHDSYYMH